MAEGLVAGGPSINTGPSQGFWGKLGSGLLRNTPSILNSLGMGLGPSWMQPLLQGAMSGFNAKKEKDKTKVPKTQTGMPSSMPGTNVGTPSIPSPNYGIVRPPMSGMGSGMSGNRAGGLGNYSFGGTSPMMSGMGGMTGQEGMSAGTGMNIGDLWNTYNRLGANSGMNKGLFY